MTPELQALIGTLITALVGALIAYLEKFRRDLAANTTKTEEIRQQTNGTLAAARNDAQKYRAVAERLSWIVREVNALPEGRALLDQVMTKHRAVVHDSDYETLISRLMREAPPK